MKLLLDSRAFLWWLAEDPELSAGARQAVADPAATDAHLFRGRTSARAR